MMRDPDFGPVRVRAFGTYTLKAADPRVLLKELVGTDGEFEADEITELLRSIISTAFADVVGEVRDRPARPGRAATRRSPSKCGRRCSSASTTSTGSTISAALHREHLGAGRGREGARHPLEHERDRRPGGVPAATSSARRCRSPPRTRPAALRARASASAWAMAMAGPMLRGPRAAATPPPPPAAPLWHIAENGREQRAVHPLTDARGDRRGPGPRRNYGMDGGDGGLDCCRPDARTRRPLRGRSAASADTRRIARSRRNRAQRPTLPGMRDPPPPGAWTSASARPAAEAPASRRPAPAREAATKRAMRRRAEKLPATTSAPPSWAASASVSEWIAAWVGSASTRNASRATHTASSSPRATCSNPLCLHVDGIGCRTAFLSGKPLRGRVVSRTAGFSPRPLAKEPGRGVGPGSPPAQNREQRVGRAPDERPACPTLAANRRRSAPAAVRSGDRGP